MSKFDPKSLKCFFLGYSQVQKGYKCYCPSLHRYLVFADVTFLENAHFFQSPIHTNQGEDGDLLVYTIASPSPTFLLVLVKPPITQVYTWCQNPPVLSTVPAASTLDPVLNDDLHIAFRKGKRQFVPPISSFYSYNHFSSHSCSFITSLDFLIA